MRAKGGNSYGRVLRCAKGLSGLNVILASVVPQGPSDGAQIPDPKAALPLEP